MLLKKLGLKPEDDREGLIEKALGGLEIASKVSGKRIEDMPEFISTRILVEECKHREPDLLAVSLTIDKMGMSAPGNVARDFSHRAAEITGHMNLFFFACGMDSGLADMGARLKDADPAVRLLITAENIRKIEEDTRQAGTSGLREKRDIISQLIGPAIATLGEPGLEARYTRAMAAAQARLDLPEDTARLAISIFGGKGPANSC